MPQAISTEQSKWFVCVNAGAIIDIHCRYYLFENCPTAKDTFCTHVRSMLWITTSEIHQIVTRDHKYTLLHLCIHSFIYLLIWFICRLCGIFSVAFYPAIPSIPFKNIRTRKKTLSHTMLSLFYPLELK